MWMPRGQTVGRGPTKIQSWLFPLSWPAMLHQPLPAQATKYLSKVTLNSNSISLFSLCSILVLKKKNLLQMQPSPLHGDPTILKIPLLTTSYSLSGKATSGLFPDSVLVLPSAVAPFVHRRWLKIWQWCQSLACWGPSLLLPGLIPNHTPREVVNFRKSKTGKKRFEYRKGAKEIYMYGRNDIILKCQFSKNHKWRFSETT